MKKIHSEKHALLYGTAHDREEKERMYLLFSQDDLLASLVPAHNLEQFSKEIIFLFYCVFYF